MSWRTVLISDATELKLKLDNLFVLKNKEEYYIPLSDNSRTLFIINNIENFILKNQKQIFLSKIKKLSDKYDINFIISSSVSDFVIGDYIDMEYINIFSQVNMYLPDITILTNTINNNYPIFKEFTEKEIIKIIFKIANDLFDANYILNNSIEDVVIKILNNFYHIKNNVNKKTVLSLEEQTYLLE